MRKGEDEAWALLEEMANNNSLWPTEWRPMKRVDTTIDAQLEKITKCLEVLSMHAMSNARATSQYTLQEESAQYVNNYRPDHNPYSNSYNSE